MDAYVLDGSIYCEDCKPEGADGPHADGGEEADSPQHCDSCRAFLENPLTSDGLDYVANAIGEHYTKGRGSSYVIAELVRFYSDALKSRPAVKLDPYAWPGGYPLIYTLHQRAGSGLAPGHRQIDLPDFGNMLGPNDLLCPECAGKVAKYGPLKDALDAQAHREGPAEECEECEGCEGCGAEIESAYGDPEAEEGESSPS